MNLLFVLPVSAAGCGLISGRDVNLEFEVMSDVTAGVPDSVEVQASVGGISIHGSMLVYECTTTTGSVDRDEDRLLFIVKNRPQDVDTCSPGNHVDQYDARLHNLDAGDYRLIVYYERSYRRDIVYDKVVTVD
jgi:hypothetical protein